MEDLEDPLVGATFAGRFDIHRRLAAGGMGAIYVARQQPTGRQVALKVIKGAQDASSVERFRREAQALAALAHPNIVTMFDSGISGETYFIAMELLAGVTLRAVIDEQRRTKVPMPLARLISIGSQVLNALTAIHRSGLVHRDLKPDNLFIVSNSVGHDDLVKLLDFGIIKDVSFSLPPSAETDGGNLTGTNSTVGTPGYLAPEQLHGLPVTTRADLYALGVILYELSTNTFPFHAPTVQAMALKQLIEPLVEPITLVPDMPPALNTIILALMDRDPERRPADAEAALRALRLTESDARPQQSASDALTTRKTLTSPLLTPQTLSITPPARDMVASVISPSGQAARPARRSLRAAALLAGAFIASVVVVAVAIVTTQRGTATVEDDEAQSLHYLEARARYRPLTFREAVMDDAIAWEIPQADAETLATDLTALMRQRFELQIGFRLSNNHSPTARLAVSAQDQALLRAVRARLASVGDDEFRSRILQVWNMDSGVPIRFLPPLSPTQLQARIYPNGIRHMRDTRQQRWQQFEHLAAREGLDEVALHSRLQPFVDAHEGLIERYGTAPESELETLENEMKRVRREGRAALDSQAPADVADALAAVAFIGVPDTKTGEAQLDEKAGLQPD